MTNAFRQCHDVADLHQLGTKPNRETFPIVGDGDCFGLFLDGRYRRATAYLHRFGQLQLVHLTEVESIEL